MDNSYDGYMLVNTEDWYGDIEAWGDGPGNTDGCRGQDPTAYERGYNTRKARP